jgi:anti-sigma28 factor (negative regulator of flagellin synthesis)
MTRIMDFQGMLTAQRGKVKGSRVASILQGRSRRTACADVAGMRSMVQAGQVAEREARVARLRMEIEAGTYRVSPGDLAECLMRSMMRR